MLRSMTGFGAGDAEDDHYKIHIEPIVHHAESESVKTPQTYE